MNKEEIAAFEAKIRDADTGGTFSSMKLKSASLSITVHRHATQIDENIGLVSYYHRNPLIHYSMNLIIWLRGKKRLWQQFWRTKVKK